jgi:hypothetical protein
MCVAAPLKLVKPARALAKAAKGGEQVFQRVVSNAELEATLNSGLLRGGREGRNFFSSTTSLDAKRAQIRLGLDGPLRDSRTPDIAFAFLLFCVHFPLPDRSKGRTQNCPLF